MKTQNKNCDTQLTKPAFMRSAGSFFANLAADNKKIVEAKGKTWQFNFAEEKAVPVTQTSPKRSQRICSQLIT